MHAVIFTEWNEQEKQKPTGTIGRKFDCNAQCIWRPKKMKKVKQKITSPYYEMQVTRKRKTEIISFKM